MTKKIIISAVLLASVISQSAFASFSDVSDTTHYKDAIGWMADNGVIDGYPDGTFGPNKCVNRVEMLKMLFEILEVDTSSYDAELFSDTDSGQWYTPYVIAAVARGTVDGYPDGTFKPSQCVNRVESVKMAILEFNDGEIPGQWGMYGVPYDIAIMENYEDQWWMPYLDTAFGGWFLGIDHFKYFDVDYGDEAMNDFQNPRFNFGPAESMTRKEVAELLYRLKTAKDNDLEYYSEEYSPMDLGVVSECVAEGSSLGAVIPGNDSVCCEGLVGYLEDDELIGTRGICVDKDNVPLTKQDAEAAFAATDCFWSPDQEGVETVLEEDKWTIGKDGCFGFCTIDKYGEEDVFVDVNQMCTGIPLNDIPLTKDEAETVIAGSECFWSLDQDDVTLEFEDDRWVMSKSGCLGTCSIDEYGNGMVFVDVNQMCMGLLP